MSKEINLILNESDLTSYALINKSKIESLKKQLELLLQKKIRLEIQIKYLKQTINKRTKNITFQLKNKVQLENVTMPVEIIDENQAFVSIPEELGPEATQAIRELLSVYKDLQKLNEDYEEQLKEILN